MLRVHEQRLDNATQQQILALGRLGWTLSRIQPGLAVERADVGRAHPGRFPAVRSENRRRCRETVLHLGGSEAMCRIHAVRVERENECVAANLQPQARRTSRQPEY